MQALNNTIEFEQEFVPSSFLAPAGFLCKKMNLSINALHNFFMLWRQAIHCFLNNLLSHHDALVGENACQIRAAALVDYSFDNQLKHALVIISNQIHEIDELLLNLDTTQEDPELTIQEFLEKNKLLFKIPKQYIKKIRFIINSYILTLTKDRQPSHSLTLNERTSLEPIKKIGFVKNKAKSLVSSAQRSLSSLSCAYIISEANQFYDPSLSCLLKIKQDAHQRSYLPQFLVGKILINKLLQEHQMIIVKIRRSLNYEHFDSITFCLRPNKSHSDFEVSNILSTNLPCMVFEGSVNYTSSIESKKAYINKLSKYSFRDIFLSSFASHPQYSGELKDLPPPFEEAIDEIKKEQELVDRNSSKFKEFKCVIEKIKKEQLDFLQKKHLASEIGTAIDNPSLLFFNHIYADMVNNHMDKDLYKIGNESYFKRLNHQNHFSTIPIANETVC